MAKRWFLVALLGLAAGVLIGLVVLDRGRKITRPLSPVLPSAVVRIRIERPPRRSIALRRVGKRWRLVEPRKLPASAFQVQRVLAEAQKPTAASDVLKGGEAERLGLDPPRVRLILNDHVIDFGSLDPLTHKRYIRSRGRIFLLLGGLEPLLAGPWWNFISRRLLPRGAMLTELRLPAMTLTRIDGVWHAQGTGAAGPNHAKSLALAWSGAYAAIVEPLDKPPTGGVPVRARLSNGQRLKWIAVFGDSSGLYRPDQHLLYEVDAATLRRLLGRRQEPAVPRRGAVTAAAGHN